MSLTIPTFSLRELETAVAKDPNGILIQDFVRALEQFGFFYLQDCDLDDAVHEPPRKAVMKFFQTASDEEKKQMTAVARRGYLALETESLAKVTNNGLYPDYSVSYCMGARDNVFPSAAFEAEWTRYYNQVSASGDRLINLTMKVFGLPAVGEYDNIMRFRLYPDLPEHRAAENQPYRIAPHHDVSFYTFIHQIPCANGFVSLQFKVRNEFVDVPTVPNTIIAQSGALLSILTKGRVTCPLHRVAAAPRRLLKGSERSASIMFFRPPPSFSFSVPLAHRLGFAEGLRGEVATLGSWVNANDTILKPTDKSKL